MQFMQSLQLYVHAHEGHETKLLTTSENVEQRRCTLGILKESSE